MNWKIGHSIFIVLVLFFLDASFYAQEGWELTKESDGIEVFTKVEEGYAFKTFKGKTIINASIHDFIYTLLDMDNYPEWGHNVKSAEILERKGDTLQIYYSIARAPFPYKNRDGVYLNRFTWNSDAKTLDVTIEVLDDYLDENEKYIRIKGYGYWKVKVKSNNQLEVIFSMQVDPGGAVPTWIANMFVEDTPFNTLADIKKVIANNKKKNSYYKFID